MTSASLPVELLLQVTSLAASMDSETNLILLRVSRTIHCCTKTLTQIKLFLHRLPYISKEIALGVTSLLISNALLGVDAVKILLVAFPNLTSLGIWAVAGDFHDPEMLSLICTLHRLKYLSLFNAWPLVSLIQNDKLSLPMSVERMDMTTLEFPSLLPFPSLREVLWMPVGWMEDEEELAFNEALKMERLKMIVVNGGGARWAPRHAKVVLMPTPDWEKDWKIRVTGGRDFWTKALEKLAKTFHKVVNGLDLKVLSHTWHRRLVGLLEGTTHTYHVWKFAQHVPPLKRIEISTISPQVRMNRCEKDLPTNGVQ
ncbi:hypothetical protein DL96DRAFT_1686482 [Flagelloscypha sp. PMI_526]|nr:hypothetical protein DL96DRAFT_1686482 [Flagelloscypha sp. PMI_526]